jgi:hypothetical protein
MVELLLVALSRIHHARSVVVAIVAGDKRGVERSTRHPPRGGLSAS